MALAVKEKVQHEEGKAVGFRDLQLRFCSIDRRWQEGMKALSELEEQLREKQLEPLEKLKIAREIARKKSELANIRIELLEAIGSLRLDSETTRKAAIQALNAQQDELIKQAQASVSQLARDLQEIVDLLNSVDAQAVQNLTGIKPQAWDSQRVLTWLSRTPWNENQNAPIADRLNARAEEMARAFASGFRTSALYQYEPLNRAMGELAERITQANL